MRAQLQELAAQIVPTRDKGMHGGVPAFQQEPDVLAEELCDLLKAAEKRGVDGARQETR